MNSKKPNPSAGATFQTIIACVREFHERFGIRNAPALEADLPGETVKLRHRLMAEEKMNTSKPPWLEMPSKLPMRWAISCTSCVGPS